MAVLENIKTEWNKLPKGGKIAFGIAVVAVVGIALYELNKGGSNATGVATASPDTGTTSPSSLTSPYPLSPSPGGNGGNIPTIPSGTCPIYDGNGNLIAWGPCTTVQPPSPNPVTNPPPASKVCPSDMHPCGKSGPPNMGCCCNKPHCTNLGTKCKC